MTTLEYIKNIKGSSNSLFKIIKRTKIKAEGIIFNSKVGNIQVTIIRQYLEGVSSPDEGLIRTCSSCGKELDEESFLIKGDCTSGDKDKTFICCKKCEYKYHFKEVFKKWNNGEEHPSD
jgi:transcription initiation factor IIE alpha subunit